MNAPAAYYNDNEPWVAEKLRELIARGQIMDGEVDERSVTEVEARDLAGFERVHLFAGIGGWDYALQLAGWDAERPVWTCSCPCPPFSTANTRKTASCPHCESQLLVWSPLRTGEAVCVECSQRWNADQRHLWPEAWRLVKDCRPSRLYGEQVASIAGCDWMSGVCGSLEILDYDPWVADIAAAGVGAPHVRQRLFWVVDANGWRLETRDRSAPCARPRHTIDATSRDDFRLGDANFARSQRRCSELEERFGQRTPWETGFVVRCGNEWKPFEPGAFPLADGISERVDKIKAFGNAIVPQAAAAFIIASEAR